MDLFYLLRLIVSEYNNKGNDINDKLYEKIIYNLTQNSSLIKDGGTMNIYYIYSNIDNNVKEKDIDYNYLGATLTIQKIIILDKYIKYNQLIINIFIFSYEKLTSLEANLSNFLYVIDLNKSIQISYLCFSDNVFTSNKINFKIYKEISLIQEFSFKKKLNINKEIERIIEITDRIKISKGNKFYIQNIYNKSVNIDKTSINSLVIILLKRNLIFELEKRLNEYQGNHKYLLKIYRDINLELNNLINLNKDKQSIIENPNIKIRNLKEDINKLVEKVSQR